MNLPKIEEGVLGFWDKEEIFQKSIENREGAPFFSFYDGPPFATGNPHYGHILATSIKDTVLRYKTMRGFQVPRRVGWDCHGLPVENLIEKEMGIKSKREIEEMGIMKFNNTCREAVFSCVDEWKGTLRRVGRWADYENSYATMDNNYIESVWWVLKTLWDRDLVYRNYRVTPYCYRCGTPVSNFEVNLGYENVDDPSVFIRFKVTSEKYKDSFLLAWTTTPWTLLGNVALVVHPEMDYLLVEEGEEKVILLKEKIEELDNPKIIEEMKGKELEGLEYEPLFDELEKEKPEGIENAFKVYLADFVNTDEGTGIVHTAVMYGLDDFELGEKHKLPFFHTVDENGKISLGRWKGELVKEVDKKIINDLKERGLLKKEEKINHSYPFCWRCDTPLLYYALHAWYIKVTQIKGKLLENNEKIFWQPEHIKSGRFGKWLEAARDWGFSRNRFWGAPIPIWECSSCGSFTCIGSKEELPQSLNDLHRPYIDEVTLSCKECGEEMKRIEEVFDCWFESGSMPYGQWHYPFENKDFVEKTFPANFIAEGVDQTRGWFYTLHVLSSALTIEDAGLGKDKPAFLNAIVNGFIFDDKGKKLSKKLKNYPDMNHVFDRYGADSLRFFLLSSTPIGEDYRFSEEKVRETYAKVVSTLYHSFSFLSGYGKEVSEKEVKHPLNKWLIARMNESNKLVIEEMEKYNLTKASREIASFIDDLSNWYIRRSRSKIKEGDEEFLFVFREIIISLSKMIAPFAPFLSEHIYKEVTGELSVHLEDYPTSKEELIDENLLLEMKEAREVVSLALKERAEAGIKVRQPLSSLKIAASRIEKSNDKEEIVELIKEEVNVKEVVFDEKLKDGVKLNTNISPELKEEGVVREITRIIQNLRKEGGLAPGEKIILFFKGEDFESVFSRWENFFQKEATILKITRDEIKDGLKEKVIQVDGKDLFLKIKRA